MDSESGWLHRSPYATTPIHHTHDLKLFFAWDGKPPTAITLHDVDACIDHCRRLGHATATINRWLAAMRTFYRSPQIESEDAPPNPILPRRHVIRQGRCPPKN